MSCPLWPCCKCPGESFCNNGINEDDMSYTPLTDEQLARLAHHGITSAETVGRIVEQARRANRLAEAVVAAQAKYLASHGDWYDTELDDARAAYLGTK